MGDRPKTKCGARRDNHFGTKKRRGPFNSNTFTRHQPGDTLQSLGHASHSGHPGSIDTQTHQEIFELDMDDRLKDEPSFLPQVERNKRQRTELLQQNHKHQQNRQQNKQHNGSARGGGKPREKTSSRDFKLRRDGGTGQPLDQANQRQGRQQQTQPLDKAKELQRRQGGTVAAKIAKRNLYSTEKREEIQTELDLSVARIPRKQSPTSDSDPKHPSPALPHKHAAENRTNQHVVDLCCESPARKPTPHYKSFSAIDGNYGSDIGKKQSIPRIKQSSHQPATRRPTTTSDAPLGEQLNNIFEDRSHRTDEDEEPVIEVDGRSTEEAAAARRNTGGSRQRNNSEKEVHTLDDEPSPACRVKEAVKRAELGVYTGHEGGNDIDVDADVDATPTRSPGASAIAAVKGFTSSVRNAVNSVTGSILGLSKQNGKPKFDVEREKQDARRHRRPNATPITAGASLRNRASDNNPKSRANWPGFSEPISFAKTRVQNSSDPWGDASPHQQDIRQLTRLRKAGSDDRGKCAPEAPRRRSSRLSTNKINDCEFIDSDDDSFDDVVLATKSVMTSEIFEPSRIAIGKKVIQGNCAMSFRDSTLIIKCQVPKGRANRANPEKEIVDMKFRINSRDVDEMKFYTPILQGRRTTRSSRDGGELNPFFAVCAKKTKDNSLNNMLFSNAYKPDGRAKESKYIIIEFHEPEALDGVLAYMTQCEKGWSVYADPGCKLASTQDAVEYVASLRTSSSDVLRTAKPRGKQAYPFLAGKDVILVYPFEGDHKEIENAARDLTCLGGSDQDFLSILTRRNATQVTDQTTGTEGADEVVTTKKFGSGTVTLRPDDFVLLEPEEWLNDNVIDFALRWISRHNDGKDAHFFSTHFYTTLAEQGVRAVASWTRKRNREFNIFDLKMIFIPINKSLHWSLCVVVNPGRITHFTELLEAQEDLSQESSDLPCLLFFDSLKSHNKNQVRKNVHAWLNAEWQRVYNDKGEPFNTRTMVMYTPEVPRQNNFCDCGVFVCRYTYALYQVHKRTSLTVKDAHVVNERGKAMPFRDVISRSQEFTFDMSEIQRLRDQLMTLIERLHPLHQAFLKEKEEREAAERAEEHLANPEEKSSSRYSQGSCTIVEPSDLKTKADAEADSEDEALSIQRSPMLRKPSRADALPTYDGTVLAIRANDNDDRAQDPKLSPHGHVGAAQSNAGETIDVDDDGDQRMEDTEQIEALQQSHAVKNDVSDDVEMENASTGSAGDSSDEVEHVDPPPIKVRIIAEL